MFRFKQFSVHDDKCAMKVGTDGVLLGAWATCQEATRILDIGTGTGLIALMLAQRTPASTVIDAIDIDSESVEQARYNVAQSPWSHRINIYHASLQDFAPSAIAARYDLIVSNPPFFAPTLASPDWRRNTARQYDSLPFEVLLHHSARLLLPQGYFCVILPILGVFNFVQKAFLEQLYMRHQMTVAAYPEKEPKRVLFCLQSTTVTPILNTIDTLHVYRHKDTKEYTKKYQELTNDFYL